MKIATRPAPSVPRNDSSKENIYQSNKPVGQVKPKKKPPPRPPPPKFNNRKQDLTASLIDLSAPLEDYLQATTTSQDLFTPLSNDDFLKFKPNSSDIYFKPTSSSNNDFFQSNTVSNSDFLKPKPTNNNDLFKRKPLPTMTNNYAVGNSSFFGNSVNHLDLATHTMNTSEVQGPKTNVVAPTIIRARPKMKKDFNGIQVNDISRNDMEANNYSPPMPTVPPPSPPKYVYDKQEYVDENVPHGIALYNYPATHKDDLPLQVNDYVILLRQINNEWLYGRVRENEGMFPANFINIRIPLTKTNDIYVTALYEFNPETTDDLKLIRGQKIRVIKKISQDWLYGESNGNYGQFPANFIDHIPTNI